METKQEQTEYHVFIHANQTVSVVERYQAAQDLGFQRHLDGLDVMPERIGIDSVSFYAEGTYDEVREEAIEKTKELNNHPRFSEVQWKFDEENIMKR